MNVLTVFTPTYNRAYCLGQLYKSLCNQTVKDFLWLIIDDGSSDNTKELVDSWIEEGLIDIQYVYKENGGMHTAHNTAYELMETELSMCIDSDDYVTNDAVKVVIDFWRANGDESCGGIYALDMDKNGDIIGEPFPEDLLRFKGWGWKYIIYDGKVYKVKGDKKFISVTKILKQYPPIPVFEGEKFYDLYFKQHLIERDYNILILNKPVCIVEYLPDGSSMNIYGQYMKSPKGFQDMRINMIQIAPLPKLRYIQTVHYINSCLILKDFKIFKPGLNKPLILSAFPLGLGLYLYTRYMNGKIRKGSLNKKVAK